MPIIVNLDVVMAKRKVGLAQLAKKIGITQANLSILKNGHAKAVRLELLEKICEELRCEVGEILAFEPKK